MSSVIEEIEMALLIGMKANIDTIVTPAQQQEIIQAFNNNYEERLSVIWKKLGEKYSYDQLRLVRMRADGK